MAIKRIWHGWTAKEYSERYQKILIDEVIPSIEAKRIPGFTKIEVLKIEKEDEDEFVTILTLRRDRNKSILKPNLMC
jgi:hypothetical protein